MTEPTRSDIEAAERRDAEALARWLDRDVSARPDPNDAGVAGLFGELRGDDAVAAGVWDRIAASPRRPRRRRPWGPVLALAAAALLTVGVVLGLPSGPSVVPGPTLAELELAQAALVDQSASPSDRLARMAQASDGGRQRSLEGLSGGR